MLENEELETPQQDLEEITESYEDIPWLIDQVIDLDNPEEEWFNFEEAFSTDSTSKRFAKILHQRNEARKEAETLKSRFQEFGIEDEKFNPYVYANQRNLEKKYPDSSWYFEQIQEITSKNPWMSRELAYKMIKFDEQNDEANQNKKLAQKTMITWQTPSDIKNFKSFGHMSSREQLEHLKNQYKKGNLKI